MVSTFALAIAWESIYISLFSGIFDREYFAVGILLLRLSPSLLCWAFQQQMGVVFLFLYRIMNSRFNVLLLFVCVCVCVCVCVEWWIWVYEKAFIMFYFFELWILKWTYSSLKEFYRWLLLENAIAVCDKIHRRRLNTVWTECIVFIVNDDGTYINNYALNV